MTQRTSHWNREDELILTVPVHRIGNQPVERNSRRHRCTLRSRISQRKRDLQRRTERGGVRRRENQGRACAEDTTGGPGPIRRGFSLPLLKAGVVQVPPPAEAW